MSFKIIRNDITKGKADAIVNTANPKPVYAGGTDSAVYIHINKYFAIWKQKWKWMNKKFRMMVSSYQFEFQFELVI